LKIILFYFSDGATDLTQLRAPHFEVLDTYTYTRQHFSQLVAEAATYTIHKKHKRKCPWKQRDSND